MKFTIKNREINNFLKPYIIAETCINHEGNLETAEKMIISAKEAGADCIKFQIHILKNEMLKQTPQSDNFKETLWETLERTNFTIEEHLKLKKFCEKNKIQYLCTPFSRDGADLLDKIDVDFFKIGSGEMTNLPLIEHVAKKGKPMIVSTGMSELDEIKETVNLIKEIKTPVVLTHCVSAYPCPYELINLRVIPKLNKIFDVPVGLSDHSNTVYTSFGAVAHGACIIEKHFTLDKNAEGPDHASSIEPKELKELVNGTRAIYLANGEEKKIFNKEKQILGWARESVVSEIDICKNETLTNKNVWVKRPAPREGAIAAKYYKKVLGKKAKVNINKDTQIKWSDISD
jgi:N-acetylneuraminate synthase